MTPPLLFAMEAAVLLVVTALVCWKCRTVLNPVALAACYYLVQTVVAPYIWWRLKYARFPSDALGQTVFLSTLYFVAVGMAYLLPLSPLRRPLSGLVSISWPFTFSDPDDVCTPAIVLLALQFVATYCALMVFSHVGTMWLFDPRQAYGFHRTGVGVWWALSAANLMLLFVVVLFRWGRNFRSVLLFAGLFVLLGYFLGSKSGTIVFLLMGAFYAHYCLRKINAWAVAILGVLSFASALLLMVLQKTAENTVDLIRYFDYFQNSVLFVSRSRYYPLQYGYISLTNLWNFVPRALYPAKPFLYGRDLLLTWVHLGAARQGYTPQMLPWCVGYADFGVLGVIAAGLVDGWISKAVYEYFLLRRNVVSLVWLWQMGFLGFFTLLVLFPAAPLPLFWIWCMAQGAIFWVIGSLRFGRRDTPFAASNGEAAASSSRLS